MDETSNDETNQNIPALGRLESVDLREVWKSEPYNFTPWLAEQTNLDALAEAIGIGKVELIQTEQKVTEFSVDIVAREIDSDVTVVIENQLDDSDHKHIGQCLTYAAGTDAKIIVWVVRSFKEGHLAALNWLNDVTEEDVGFFGVEVEAWKIGLSLPAPRFNVRARPNHWVKTLRHSKASLTVSDIGNIEYWNSFNEIAREYDWHRSERPIKGTNVWQKLYGEDSYEAWLHGWVDRGAGKHIGIALRFTSNSEETSEKLIGMHQDILAQADEVFDFPVAFRNLDKKAPELFVQLQADPDDKAHWENQHIWLAENARRFRSLFENKLKDSLNF